MAAMKASNSKSRAAHVLWDTALKFLAPVPWYVTRKAKSTTNALPLNGLEKRIVNGFKWTVNGFKRFGYPFKRTAENVKWLGKIQKRIEWNVKWL